MAAPTLTPDYVRRFAADFGFFCEQVGMPRTDWQLEAMELKQRQTIIVAPRQTGKSESLSLRAAWAAFRKPNQLIMVVSASETAAQRLLGLIREVCTHPLLSGAVVDETMTRLILSNGSKILSVPASEKSIRGWSVDLLIVDECAFVSDDILLSAAIPTTTARPEARIVLCSTPWGDSGAFYNLAMKGMAEGATKTKTFRWKLIGAPWVTEDTIEIMRATLPPLRFRTEYEGEFVGSGDAYFYREDILACVADFQMLREGLGMPVKCGLDWGRQQDAHAIALAGLMDDYGVNGKPIIVVPYIETSRRPYGSQVAEIEQLARIWDMEIRTETNGVGAYPSEELNRRIGGWTRVIPQGSSQKSKEDYYGRLHALFSTRRIVIPADEELIRQLAGMTATPTSSGGLRIEARQESTHDDLADALALAVGQMPLDLDFGVPKEPPEDAEWAETPYGVKVPVPVRTRFAEPDWGSVYSGASAASAAPVEAANPWAAVYAPKSSGTEAVLKALRSMADGQ